MKNKNFYTAVIVSGLLFFITSCVNLQKINDYSSNSGKSLKKFEELGYSFTGACNDKCEIEQWEKNQLAGTVCNCKAEKEADSITLLIYTTVKGYFEGVTKLSQNELTNYKFNALSKALKEGSFGDVKVNKDHVDAYMRISSILTRAVTDAYRRRKLSIYIGDANDAIKVLLGALEFNLVSNLSGKLAVKQQRLESYYFDLSKDSTSSVYEKKKIIEEYNTSVADIENKQMQIAAFGKGLRSIANGHQELYNNRNKLKARQLKDLLTQYASDIQDVVDEFNKLKNQK